MGGCLDFVELGDVVQDRDEDDRQDVHVTAADLSSKTFLQISLNEKTKRPGVLTLCFIYCLIQRIQRQITSSINRLNFPNAIKNLSPTLFLALQVL